MRHLVRFMGFQLERWVQRGILQQLLLVGGVIVAIAVAFGLAAWASTDAFDEPSDSIWWAFLRLTDPGYLGDDDGSVLRTLSTIVTVLGYVLFMGSLVAIMTQALTRRIKRMDDGLTPIAMRGHVVVLGWTNRTPEIVREVMAARGRLRRFLDRINQRRLRIVVVTDDKVAERRQVLRALLGRQSGNHRIFMRLGSESNLADLARFDLARAGAIIVPGDEFRHHDTESSDSHVVRTLLGIRTVLAPIPMGQRPQVVAEILDPRKRRAAERALGSCLEIVLGDQIIARLMAQAIREPRLVELILTLLNYARGHSLYAWPFPEATGRHPSRLADACPDAVVLGAVRTTAGGPTTHLNPPADFRLEPNDHVVCLARSSEDLVPSRDVDAPVSTDSTTRIPSPVLDTASSGPGTRKVLILGWSTKIGSTLEELNRSASLEVEITLVSRRPTALREAALDGFAWDRDRIRLEHVERDFTMSGVLESLDPTTFDSILLMANTDMPSSDGADARTIIGYELTRSVIAERLAGGAPRPNIVVELVDPGSEDLLADGGDTVLMTPRILGNLQAHVALLRAHVTMLRAFGSIFDALLLSGRLILRSPGDYGLSDEVTHAEAMQAATARGEIIVALIRDGDRLEDRLDLCPPADRRWKADHDTLIAVVSAAE